MTNDIFIYLTIGLIVGILLQLTNDWGQNMVDRLKDADIELEDMPKFTLMDHLKIIVIWPFVVLTVITEIFTNNFTDSSKK